MYGHAPLSLNEGDPRVACNILDIGFSSGEYVGRVDEEYKVLKKAVYEIDAVDLDS